MASADFCMSSKAKLDADLPSACHVPRVVRAYSLPAGRQASSDACGIYSMKFVGQGRCEDVLTYPLHSASVYRSCSSVPGFVVSLPSVLASQQTTLRLTNWLRQLANERLALSGIFKVSLPMLGAHKMLLQ
jgi:hypothetical protein